MQQEVVASREEVKPQRLEPRYDSWPAKPEVEEEEAVQPDAVNLEADPDHFSRDLTQEEIFNFIPEAARMSPESLQKEILNVKSWIIASRLQDAECERLTSFQSPHRFFRKDQEQRVS